MQNKTVNHVSATRQRLELMHIDLWALREQATQNITPRVWRDQFISDEDQHAEQHAFQVNTVEFSGSADDERAEQILRLNEQMHQSQMTQTRVEQPVEAPLTPILNKPVVVNPPEYNLQDQIVQPQISQNQISQNQIAQNQSLQDQTAQEQNSHRFEWQLCILPQVVLLVDVTAWLQLTPDADGATAISAQQSLWQNIIQALHAQSLALLWPPVIQQWQEPRGQSAYVSGFLAAYVQHKNMIVLGQMPAHQTAMLKQLLDGQALIEMPSLAEMLLNWRHKQSLWLKIREYNRLDLAQD